MAAERQWQGATARKEIGNHGSGEMVRTAIGMCAFRPTCRPVKESLPEAQQGAIRQYCELQYLRLLAIHQTFLSGGKSQRPGSRMPRSDSARC